MSSTKAFLLTLLFIFPTLSAADMLHIKDSEEEQNTINAASSASGSIDFQESYSVLPGNEWKFGFSFKDSPTKFNWIVDVTVESDPRESGHKHNNPLHQQFAGFMVHSQHVTTANS